MAKFKVGDRVKVVKLNEENEYLKLYINKIGKIDEIFSNEYPFLVKFSDGKKRSFKKSELELVNKRGRPKKEKPVIFIAKYDEQDGDPIKEFTSKKDLKKWLNEAKEDENIIFSSIKVYPTGEMMKPELIVKLKEVK